MYGAIRENLQREIESIHEAGLYKEERQILTPQGADIRVAYPEGSPPREVVNFCANNYLGLSSHPRVLEAARNALDSARLWHEQRPLHLRNPGHPQRAGTQAQRVPRHRRDDPLCRLLRREWRRL